MRKILFTAQTPYLAVPVVVCYEDTWLVKLAPRVLEDSYSRLTQALSQPTCVCAGTSNSRYLAFVNDKDVSARKGAPFVVFVDPDGLPSPVIASAGHRHDFKSNGNRVVLWS